MPISSPAFSPSKLVLDGSWCNGLTRFKRDRCFKVILPYLANGNFGPLAFLTYRGGWLENSAGFNFRIRNYLYWPKHQMCHCGKSKFIAPRVRQWHGVEVGREVGKSRLNLRRKKPRQGSEIDNGLVPQPEFKGSKAMPAEYSTAKNWHVPSACVSTGSKPSSRSNFSTFLLLACLFFFRSSFSWTERDNAIATCSDSHRSADSAITSSNCDHSASCLSGLRWSWACCLPWSWG